MTVVLYLCAGVVLTLISLFGIVAGIELAWTILDWWKRR